MLYFFLEASDLLRRFLVWYNFLAYPQIKIARKKCDEKWSMQDDNV